MVKIITSYNKDGKEVALKVPKIELKGIGDEEVVKFTALYGQFYEDKKEYLVAGEMKKWSEFSLKVKYHKPDGDMVSDHEVYVRLSEAQKKSFDIGAKELVMGGVYEAYKTDAGYINFRVVDEGGNDSPTETPANPEKKPLALKPKSTVAAMNEDETALMAQVKEGGYTAQDKAEFLPALVGAGITEERANELADNFL